MKNFVLCGLLILFFSINALSKSATVHITIKNFSGSIDIYNPELRYNLTKKKLTDLHLDEHQSASYTVDIDHPTYLVLYFLSNKFFNYCLFLTPGDELFLTADFTLKKNNITVTGRGSSNNQPEIFALTNMDMQPLKGYATPDRVIAAINKQFLINKALLAKYIRVNKPSSAFIKTALVNLAYFVPVTYYEFNHNNNFGKPKEQLRRWKKVQDSVFATIKLNNNDALSAYNYTHLIDQFLMREPEELSMQFRDHPVLFYKQWFHSDTVQGRKVFNTAQKGILINKIIDKYFTGKASEYAYGQAIKYVFNEADYPATVLLFDHFKKKYPASVYIKAFSTPIAKVVKKQRQAFDSNTIFVKNNGTTLNTFKDVLSLTKGKVALVDMWGTWCSPCRQEIEKNAAQLKAHFRGKDIAFLYIANYDIKREKEWKKQIAYFKIEGEHILANSKLTADIMGKVKASGYPTYIIIKKDGSYKQTVTKYPINLQAMIKEIESAGL